MKALGNQTEMRKLNSDLAILITCFKFNIGLLNANDLTVN